MWRLTAISGWSAVIISLLTVFADHWWLADLFANLRVQLTICLLATAVLLMCFQKWKLAVLQLVLAGLHLPWLICDFRFETTGAMNDPPLLTVTTANVLTGNQRNKDIEEELIAGSADVIAVLELSTNLREQLAGDFAQIYPYSVLAPQDSANFGIGLYSKHPLNDPRIDEFITEGIPSASASISCDGRQIHILATHPPPPISSMGYDQRNEHLNRLSTYVRQYRHLLPDVPVVVMGDLNLTPWSPVFSSFLNNAALRRAGTQTMWSPTWYHRFPYFPFGLVIDHVLMTNDLTDVYYTTGQDVGSDHRFVSVSLSVKQVAQNSASAD